jgi:hypothetical protein
VRAGVELTTWAPRFRASDLAQVEVLAADPVRSVNDNSLVVTVAYRGRRLLFTGDIESEGEELLVAARIRASTSSRSGTTAARPRRATRSSRRPTPRWS